MATDYVRFTVKVLPAITSPGRQSQEVVQTLAIGAKRTDTFGDLLQKVEARYDARYNKDERGGQVEQLQDFSGADIFDDDAIGSLYDESSFGQQEVIYARLALPCTGTAVPSMAEEGARGAKRRLGDEGLTGQSTSAKRRKVDEDFALYQRVDADGFKIPRRKEMRTAPVPGDAQASSATVLVEDSQPEPVSAASGSALARFQQQQNAGLSSPATRSSPLVAAASRNAGNAKAGKAFPTPDSRDRQRQDATRTPGQPALNAQRVSSWFKRTPVSARSGGETTATQDDPIEDVEAPATVLRSAEKVNSSSRVANAKHGQASHDDTHQLPTVPDVSRVNFLKSEDHGKPRTPSVGRSISTQADGSERQRNSSRSVAKGWTKEEDEKLLEGLSARKGARIVDVLKEKNIDRSASAARGRFRLLVQQKKDAQSNTLALPSSSLALPLSESEEEPPVSSTQPKVKRWSQSEVGILRKAICEGFDAREIQANHFPSRTEEAVMGKMRDVRKSVLNLERMRDDFPNDDFTSPRWTDQHNLTLRRAYREGLNVVATASRYFKSVPTTLVERKVKAYRQQMENLTFERAMSQQSPSKDAYENQAVLGDDAGVGAEPDEPRTTCHDAAAEPTVPHSDDDVDAELLRHFDELDRADSEADGPVIEDSYETTSAIAFGSSPPLLRKPIPPPSPRVVIPPSEQRGAQRAQRSSERIRTQSSQLRRSTSSGGQTHLNFQRDKGKIAARPMIDLRELDRQYSTRLSHEAARTAQLPREFIEVSSDAEGSDADDCEDLSGTHTSQPLPQSNGSSSTVKQKQEQANMKRQDSDGNSTTSSGEPGRQLAFELEQSMSAAEQSTQSQTAPGLHTRTSGHSLPTTSKPVAYVRITGPARRPASSRAQNAQWQDSEDENVAFQTQDPKTTLSQKERRKRASPLGPSRRTESKTLRTHDGTSDEESSCFQTQDPATTLSQKQHLKSQRTNRSMAQDAVDDSVATSKGEQSHHNATNLITSIKAKSRAAAEAASSRRSVYDIPDSSPSPVGSHSERTRTSLPLSSAERRGPGQLPRILGPASKLKQRKKDAEAKAAARKAEREARSCSHSLSTALRSHDVDLTVQYEVSRNSAEPPVPLPPPKQGSEQVIVKLMEPQETSLSSEDGMRKQAATHAASTVAGADDSESQSQVQLQPTIELPYPQILSRESGANGKLEVGRPGFSWLAPHDCAYLRTDEAIFAAASRDGTDECSIKRLAEDYKLQDQQGIAMCCDDHDKLRQLHKVERRYRRERRVEDGEPPSRGPSAGYWFPGMPKPIQWDVNVMPDSDDSMSSRGRGQEDIDEEMADEEDARASEMDNEENPAYFDKDRRFSEVEDDDEEEDEEQADATQRFIEDVDVLKQEMEDKFGDDAVGCSASYNEVTDDMVTALANGVDVEGEPTAQNTRADERVEESDAGGLDSDDAEAVVGADASNNGRSQFPAIVKSMHVDEVNGATSSHDDMPVANGSSGLVSRVEQEDEGDEGLTPTAPPPVTNSVDELAAVQASDRELQDLAQSRDVDIHLEESASESRLSPGLGAPTLPSQEGVLDTDSPVLTNSFSPTNTKRSDEGSVEYWRRRNASPNRNPELTDSMLPPWPSSGKVRSSLEDSATQTPLIASETPRMVSAKQQVHAGASGNGKKPKLGILETERSEVKASRKAKKKERRAERLALKLQKASTSGLLEEQQMTVATWDVITPGPATTSEPALETTTISKKSKKALKKERKRQHAEGTTTAGTVQEHLLPSTKIPQATRISLPPPAIAAQHKQVIEQSSLPSPDSEFHGKAGKGGKRAKKRAKREARNGFTSADAKATSGSDASLSRPVAPFVPTVAVAQIADPAVVRPLQVATVPALPVQVKQASAETPSPKSLEKKVKKQSQKKIAKFSEESSRANLQSETPSAEKSTQPAETPPGQVPQKPSHKHRASTTRKISQSTEQAPSDPTTKHVAQPIAKRGAEHVDEVSNAPSRKKIKAKSTSSEEQHAGKSSAQLKTARMDKPAIGASTGLMALADFEADIPKAPKARPQVDKGPVKPFLFDDDEDESESSDSGDG